MIRFKQHRLTFEKSFAMNTFHFVVSEAMGGSRGSKGAYVLQPPQVPRRKLNFAEDSVGVLERARLLRLNDRNPDVRVTRRKICREAR